MEQKGSFIGFTFGNRHSSTLGILRTSNSGRYEQSLAPNLADVVTDVPGADGQIYWGSRYTNREIPISFAFYGLTEEQLRQIKEIVNDKKIHDLILDEEPYKIWSAKLTGVSTMKHICFDNGSTCFYAGEGTFVFTTYYPFARSRYEYIEDYEDETNILEWNEDDKYLRGESFDDIIYPAILTYGNFGTEDTGTIIAWEESFQSWLDEVDLLTDSEIKMEGANSYIRIFGDNTVYNNLNEWQDAANFPSRTQYGTYINGAYKLNNTGDIDMQYTTMYRISNIPENGLELKISDSKKVKIKKFAAIGNDVYVLIDSRNNIIRGYDINKKATKNLYNKYITEGMIFDIPVGECELYSTIAAEEFEYHYLYL